MKKSILILLAIAFAFTVEGKPSQKEIRQAQKIFAKEYVATLDSEGRRRLPVNEAARIGMYFEQMKVTPDEYSETSYPWYTGYKLFSGNLHPKWDNSQMHSGYLIVPVDMEQRFGALRFKNEEDISPSLVFPVYQRIVVDIKNKRCYELFAIPAEENLPYDANNLNINDFNGVIICADFTGNMVCAAKYSKGKLIDKSASSDGADLGKIIGTINVGILTSPHFYFNTLK